MGTRRYSDTDVQVDKDPEGRLFMTVNHPVHVEVSIHPDRTVVVNVNDSCVFRINNAPVVRVNNAYGTD